MDEMQIRDEAPLLSRPVSPERPERERKRIRTLADIPEATPGPNAFAQQAARMERHRQDGNAFYQQQVQKRNATPPTDLHPALRVRSNSDLLPSARDSSCTTMSPFINSGRENSPPLRLVPSNADMAQPTQRGFIEERREREMHEQSGSTDNRTPVFMSMPKIATYDFATQFGTPKKHSAKAKGDSNDHLGTKTPRKGIFERLKITTTLRSDASPSVSTLSNVYESEPDQRIPVKAQAVLGTTPSKAGTKFGSSTSRTNIPRSPSKRKGFFSRKNSSAVDPVTSSAPITLPSNVPVTYASSEPDHQPPSVSTVVYSPYTAISDPTHYSYQRTPSVPQWQTDKGARGENGVSRCGIARSQSLKYFDHTIPPTPPAKNTPPDEKARKQAALAKKSSRMPFHGDQRTPSKEPIGIVSTSGRISPTRFGSYGHREMPFLVTKPSVYSLHASVVPNLTDPTTLEEMKARFDPLGLEGFSMPPENMRSPQQTYTPSVYSTDWTAQPSNTLAGFTPHLQQLGLQSESKSTHTKQSSSSGGEIEVCYPELLKDPSVGHLTPAVCSVNHTVYARRQGRERLEAHVPWHGHTHSRDHSNSPRPSIDSNIFAHHVDDDLNKFYDSPTSFSHASATPSPLQTLPASVYKPQSKCSKLHLSAKPEISFEQAIDDSVHALGIKRQIQSSPPQRRNEIFENAPALSPQSNRGLSCPPSAEGDFKCVATAEEVYGDPQKKSVSKSPSGTKLDRMIDMLDQINSRNKEISTMCDEFRASNARLDRRLAAVEEIQRASSPSWASDKASSDGEGAISRFDGKRIATQVAKDFYRTAQPTENGVDDSSDQREQSGSDTITALQDTNRGLLEMVSGFASKIQALEKKFGENV